MRTFVAWVASCRVTAVVIVCVVVGPLPAAADPSLPHTFTSGTPAKAAEVNANFGWLADRVVPVGAVVAYAGTTAPSGWLLCDGAAVSRTEYPELFAVLGIVHGYGDQITTFNVPDYRGRFLRGADGGAGRDPDAATRTMMAEGGATGDNVGSVQGDGFASHAHPYTDPGHAHLFGADSTGGWNWGNVGKTSDRRSGSLTTDTTTTGISIGNAGGNETRPTNAFVNYIIKY